jgi:hypothetical protein
MDSHGCDIRGNIKMSNQFFGFNSQQEHTLRALLGVDNGGEVGTADLAAGAVTTAKIANSAVTGAKLGAMTSLELKTALSDETGSGAAVFATSPTLVTPNLGTPTALVLTSATGLVNAGVDAAAAIAATKLAVAAGTNGLSAANLQVALQAIQDYIVNLNTWAIALATKLNADAGVTDTDYDTNPQA